MKFLFIREKEQLRTRSDYIYMVFLSFLLISLILSPILSLKEGAAEEPRSARRTFGAKPQEATGAPQDLSGETGAPDANISEEEIIKFKARAAKLKPLLEKDREVMPRVRQVIEEQGRISRIFLTQGYGTVISLPYAFTLDGVALGDKSKFQVEAKGNSLVIYPLKQFKQTNLIVFETVKNGNPPVHQYLLVEDSSKTATDFQVNVQAINAGWIGVDDDFFTATLINAVIRGTAPGRDTAEGLMLEGREPFLSPIKDKLPFLQRLTLTAPALYVFLIEGRVTPVEKVEWVSYLDSSTTVVATASKEVSVRRLYDGKIFNSGK